MKGNGPTRSTRFKDKSERKFTSNNLIRTKNIGNAKFVRRFRALSFPYEKVVISVAKKPRPSHRAKIGENIPGRNRHKYTKTAKKEFDIKTNTTRRKRGVGLAQHKRHDSSYERGLAKVRK